MVSPHAADEWGGVETIRIFGGRHNAGDHAVDVTPVAADEESTAPAPRPDRKPLYYWAFLATAALVAATSGSYMTMRMRASAASLPASLPAVQPVAQAPVPQAAVQPSEKVKRLAVPPADAGQPMTAPIRVKRADTFVQPPDVASFPKEWADIGQPMIGKWYLQLGSLDKGVAEVIVQGLRTRGFNAVWGPGITDKLGRVLVGPFDSLAQTELARKRVEDVGFKPFARVITQADMKPGTAPPVAAK